MMTETSGKSAALNANKPKGARRWLIAVLPALMLLGGVATTALARGDGWRNGPPDEAQAAQWRQKRIEKMMDHINATPAQRTQINAVFANHQEDMKSTHEQRRQLHEALRAALTAPKVDAAAVEAVRTKMVAQMDKSSRQLSNIAVQLGQILTQEQRQTLAEHMAHARHRGFAGAMGF